MSMRCRPSWFALVVCVCAGLLSALSPRALGQTLGEPEEFTAIAIVNNNLTSGAGTVLIRINRWSTEAERTRLIETLQKKGPEKLLDELQHMRSVGTIRTPDSLAYNLRYANQRPGEDGGRQIVLATDRPIGFWEAVRQPRTIQYPFTVDPDADGTRRQRQGHVVVRNEDHRARRYRGTRKLRDATDHAH